MDEQLLEDFVAWRERRAQQEVDLSPRAFLEEREHELNTRRITEAVAILEETKDVYSDDFIPEGQPGNPLDADAILEWARGTFSRLDKALA